MPRILPLLVAAALASCSPAQAPGTSPPPAGTSERSSPPRAAPDAKRVSRLRADGTLFRTREGQIVHWRGISAFRLVDLVARGSEAEAIALLDWAAAQRLTVVRAFVMARHLFQLAPEAGIAALPRLLQLAAARGLYVEVVALADTAGSGIDFEQHMRALGPILSTHDNAILEVANEPWHPTQHDYLHDARNVQALAKLVPPEVTVALGSAEAGEGYAAGHYVTWHAPRGSREDGWEHVLTLTDGAGLLAKWQKPLVSDEPIGAASTWIAGRRDNDPRRFAAAAALTRLAGMGATFHFEGGLQARIPAGVELACFRAWNDALDLLDELPEGGTFRSRGEAQTIASAPVRSIAARDYGAEAWVVTIDGAAEPAVTWADGWKQTFTRSSTGVTLFRGRR